MKIEHEYMTLEKVFDKAYRELNYLANFAPQGKLPFDDETRKRYMNSLDENECINIL